MALACLKAMNCKTAGLSRASHSRYRIPKDYHPELSRHSSVHDIYNGELHIENSVIFGFYEPLLTGIVDFIGRGIRSMNSLATFRSEHASSPLALTFSADMLTLKLLMAYRTLDLTCQQSQRI